MFLRYSEMEMNQWDDACTKMQDHASAAPRPSRTRASTAKGQAELAQNRSTMAQPMTQKTNEQDWASECLFDCYNG